MTENDELLQKCMTTYVKKGHSVHLLHYGGGLLPLT